MMFLSNVSLKPLNTFGIESITKQYFCIKNESDFNILIENQVWKKFPFFVLGGGSNVLLPRKYEGLIIHVCTKGINIIAENSTNVFVEVAAGELWEDFVDWSVKNNYGGVENLALIPGYCGSSPVQNIGAYGVEVKDVIEKVNFIQIDTGERRSFNTQECQFDYRTSVFKQELKNRILITSVVYRLSKENKVNLSYNSLIDFFSKQSISNPSLFEVYNAVKQIRQSKLPDHKLIGNAGSFFKNPIVSFDDFNKLIANQPNLIHWEMANNKVKLAAAQLIELSGWKGKRIGDAGVHVNQALVLVNYDNATGEDIMNLAKKIIKDVQLKFNVIIEPEVNVLS